MRNLFKSLPIDIDYKKEFRVTSMYGKRNTGIAGASKFHKGIDIGRNISRHITYVKSVAAGYVVDIGFTKYRGNYIKIRHAGGYDTLYQHLEKMYVLLNDEVSFGTIIGVMGNSSDPTVLKIATHLHMEVHYNGKEIDPYPFIADVFNNRWIEMTREETLSLIREEIESRVFNTDTEPSLWAADAWRHYTKQGIFDGKRPQSVVTRQQLAVILDKINI